MNKITLITPLNRLGYGVTGVNLARTMIKMGVDVTICPIGPPDMEKRDALDLGKLILGIGKPTYDPTAPQVRNFHEFDVKFLPGTGRKLVWPFFEVDKIKPMARSMLNSTDVILAGSRWIKDILISNGVTSRIEIAHLGVDTGLFAPKPSTRSDTNYRFFTIGKFELRKGHQDLITAFKRAFPTESDVRLYMMVGNPFINREAMLSEIHTLSSKDPRIVVVDRAPSHAEVAAFINNCDCGVFPSRGEGWGLPITEALACSKPVISTFITSMTEYLNKDIAIEIETTSPVPAHDGVFFNGFGNWRNPIPGSIIAGLRTAYDNKLKHNEPGRNHIVENFTWTHSATQCLEAALKN